MLVLTFQVGPEHVGLDIRRVLEVIPRVELRPLTGTPKWVAGVFVYHGRVIPVVDLFQLTGHGECPSHLSSRIILVPLGDTTGVTGLLASQVADLREVSATAIASPQEQGAAVDLGPVVADGRGVIRLLDPDRFLAPAARQLMLSVVRGSA